MCTLPRGHKSKAKSGRRHFSLESRIREAIDDAGLEDAFRVQGLSSYDRGYYHGLSSLAERIYKELSNEAPF